MHSEWEEAWLGPRGRKEWKRKITEKYKTQQQQQNKTPKQTKNKRKPTTGYQNLESKTTKSKGGEYQFQIHKHYNSCDGNKNFQRFPQCLQIQFHVQPRTFSFHIKKLPVSPPGPSATYLLWYSLSEQQRGWETGGSGVRHKGGQRSVHWRELSKEEVLHIRTHLVKERGQRKL